MTIHSSTEFQAAGFHLAAFQAAAMEAATAVETKEDMAAEFCHLAVSEAALSLEAAAHQSEEAMSHKAASVGATFRRAEAMLRGATTRMLTSQT